MDLVDFPASGSEAPFGIGIYPVTNIEFLEFLRQNPTQSQYLRGALETLIQEIGRNPVTSVTWYEAEAFCTWKGLYLPSSREWEVAAGETPTDVLPYAWVSENSGSRPHPVGKKLPNGFGLYDMWGNVWEWTTEAAGSYRVLRGGGWNSLSTNLRAANRNYDVPGGRSDDVGFRCSSHQPRVLEFRDPDLRWKQILETIG